MDLSVLPLGKCDYEEAFDIQLKVLERRAEGQISDTLILVEHPPVITLGRHADQANITASPELLASLGVELFPTTRGGDVTYHGPGQIVGYPIFNLRRGHLGIREFVDGLEQLFINLLREEYGIQAGRHPEHRGVWIGDNKIVAIGLAVRRGITMHGFAFNVNTNLDHFDLIVPCGIVDRGVTSLEKITGAPVDCEQATRQVIKYFCHVFGFTGHTEVSLTE